MSFLTALSGLNAATSNLGVISNNIANANTAGFKESRAEFADVFNSGRIGTGVDVAAVTQQFQQGSVNGTGNALDMAINGEGFFQVRDQSGAYYTRAGQFGLDKEGFVVNSAGQKLAGFVTDANGNLTGTLGDLQLPNGEGPPKATSRINFGANLSATSEASTLPFDHLDSRTYNHSTSLSVYDSQGNQHTLSLYFIKDPAENDWTVRAGLNGKSPDATDGNGDPLVELDSSTLDYTREGLLDLNNTQVPIAATFHLDRIAAVDGQVAGAERPLEISLDFSETTQFGGPSSSNALAQDGYTSGRLVGVEVADDGVVSGRYSNGQALVIGQVALVNFRNVQGLEPVGGSNWVQSGASGDPVPGSPQTGGLGAIRSQALESSNVEMTEQLVNMISAQRGFQANAQVISASDQMQQTILNNMR